MYRKSTGGCVPEESRDNVPVGCSARARDFGSSQTPVGPISDRTQNTIRLYATFPDLTLTKPNPMLHTIFLTKNRIKYAVNRGRTNQNERFSPGNRTVRTSIELYISERGKKITNSIRFRTGSRFKPQCPNRFPLGEYINSLERNQ